MEPITVLMVPNLLGMIRRLQRRMAITRIFLVTILVIKLQNKSTLQRKYQPMPHEWSNIKINCENLKELPVSTYKSFINSVRKTTPSIENAIIPNLELNGTLMEY